MQANDGILEKISALSLRALGGFAGSKIAQDTGLDRLAKDALYLGSRTVVNAAAQVSSRFTAARDVLPLERLRRPEKKSAPLFDLTLSEDQQMLAEMLESLAQGTMRSEGKQADEDGKTPKTFFAKIVETGIFGVAIPESLGGAAYERSPVTVALIAEKLGFGDYSLALKVLSSIAFINLLSDFGTDAQQQKYLPAFVGNEYVQGTLAVMEPALRFDPNKMTTRAERSHSGYWLNGEKCMVLSGQQADVLLIFARLEGAGVQPFIVEKNYRGMSWLAERHMGLKAAALATLKLENVHVPEDALLGEAESKFDLQAFVDSSRIALAALTTGTLKAAIDYAVEYCNAREAFGEPVTHRQAVAFMLADMATEYEALRLMTYRAAARVEHELEHRREAYLADLYSAKYSMSIATDAVQLLGGHGYTREHPVEMWYRHLRASAILKASLCV